MGVVCCAGARAREARGLSEAAVCSEDRAPYGLAQSWSPGHHLVPSPPFFIPRLATETQRSQQTWQEAGPELFCPPGDVDSVVSFWSQNPPPPPLHRTAGCAGWGSAGRQGGPGSHRYFLCTRGEVLPRWGRGSGALRCSLARGLLTRPWARAWALGGPGLEPCGAAAICVHSLSPPVSEPQFPPW